MNRFGIGFAALAFIALFVSGCSGGKDKPKGPGAPGSLNATAGDSEVTLTWQPAVRAERYIVYIAEEPGISKENYDQLAGGGRYDFDGIESPFTVDTLQNGTTYFFIVTSVNASNYEGPESGEVQANPSPWGPPTVLEATSGEAIGLTAGVDDAGNLLAVWGRAEVVGRQAIHSARYDSSISDWGSIAILDSAYGISGTPSLAVHPAGDAFVAWRQGTGPDDVIFGADFDSVNGWDPPFLLTDSGSLVSRNPAVAFAGDDLFALWTQNYLLGTNMTLTAGLFGKVAGNGTAFGPTEQRDLATSSTDRVRVVAAANRGMAAFIQDDLLYTDEWTGAWAGAAAVATTSDEPLAAYLATNEDADMVLMWTEQNLSVDLYAIRYDGLTSTWGPVEIVEQGALDVLDVSVGVCPGGEPVAVFTQMAGLHSRLMASRFSFNDDTWSTPAILYESLDGDSRTPSLALDTFDSECTVRVVWVQEVVGLGGPGTTVNIYSTRNSFDDAPDDWGNALLVSEFGLNSSPLILVDDDGNVTAMWEYYGPGVEEIWFNRLGD